MTTTLPPTGNTAVTRPENRAFFPALDGLRAVAFLMVFGQHYLYLYLAWGWTGVNIFFVLSGFLITGILFDSRQDPYRARNFYVRRTLRIFPLHYGLFAALLLRSRSFTGIGAAIGWLGRCTSATSFATCRRPRRCCTPRWSTPSTPT